MNDGDINSALGAGEEDLVTVALPPELEKPSGLIGAVYSAIDAQRSAAISYVRGIRRRQPNGTPADIIKALERHYLLSVTASGTAVGATAFIPGAGTAIALGAGAAELLLQFELAALFGLATAEVHGMNIQDRDRARALILSLMVGQDGRTKIANLARTAIRKDSAAPKSIDDLPLADLLGTAIPADVVPSILESVKDLAKERVPEKVAIAGTRLVPGGIGMVLGALGGYTAGNDVVQAARQAFGALPAHLPEWLEPLDSDGDGVPDVGALENGMRDAVGKFVQVSGTAGGAISSAATTVGAGLTAAATNVSRQFRSVDLDGDGIPDEAPALTAAKRAGRTAAEAGGAVRGAAASFFRSKTPGRRSPDGFDADSSDEHDQVVD